MDSVSKHYRVIFSERATDMLIQHVRFIAKVSPEAADKLRGEIYRSVKISAPAKTPSSSKQY